VLPAVRSAVPAMPASVATACSTAPTAAPIAPVECVTKAVVKLLQPFPVLPVAHSARVEISATTALAKTQVLLPAVWLTAPIAVPAISATNVVA